MKRGNNYLYLWQFITLPIIIVLLFTSCKILYIPTTHNSPMLSNKDEFQVSALVGTGVNLQSAYAVTDHVGLMLNGFFLSSNKEIDLGSDSTKKINELWLTFEAGAGYFTKVLDVFTFEIYAGGGTGRVPGDFRNVNYTYDGTQTAPMSKLFIQPAIGFRSKIVDISGVTRFSAITMNNQMWYFFEPGVVAKLGYKNFRFIGSVGLSKPMEKLVESTWDYMPVSMGLGLQYNIGRKY